LPLRKGSYLQATMMIKYDDPLVRQREFAPEMIDSLKGGAAAAVGVDRAAYLVRVDEVAPEVRTALTRDFA
jgi:hypothetical protein